MNEILTKFKALKTPAKVAVIVGPLMALSMLSCGCCCVPLWMHGNSDGVQQRIKDREAAIPTVNAPDLLRAYADNEARAERDYGKGRIKVQGRVTGFLGDTVTLEGLPAITCNGLTRNEVASLQNGQEATIEGRVTLGNAGGIWLGDCKLR